MPRPCLVVAFLLVIGQGNLGVLGAPAGVIHAGRPPPPQFAHLPWQARLRQGFNTHFAKYMRFRRPRLHAAFPPSHHHGGHLAKRGLTLWPPKLRFNPSSRKQEPKPTPAPRSVPPPLPNQHQQQPNARPMFLPKFGWFARPKRPADGRVSTGPSSQAEESRLTPAPPRPRKTLAQLFAEDPFPPSRSSTASPASASPPPSPRASSSPASPPHSPRSPRSPGGMGLDSDLDDDIIGGFNFKLPTHTPPPSTLSNKWRKSLRPMAPEHVLDTLPDIQEDRVFSQREAWHKAPPRPSSSSDSLSASTFSSPALSPFSSPSPPRSSPSSSSSSSSSSSGGPDWRRPKAPSFARLRSLVSFKREPRSDPVRAPPVYVGG